ncbi:MAG: hypothetical protein BGO03_17150 [Mesorhizobium sp. 61-13]|nr:MAG: hypothetical protein BGO03_17150 [Mesorhizobium sp. 61-13]
MTYAGCWRSIVAAKSTLNVDTPPIVALKHTSYMIMVRRTNWRHRYTRLHRRNQAGFAAV